MGKSFCYLIFSLSLSFRLTSSFLLQPTTTSISSLCNQKVSFVQEQVQGHSKRALLSKMYANKTKKSNSEKAKQRQTNTNASTSEDEMDKSMTTTDQEKNKDNIPLPVRDPLMTDMGALAEDKLPEGPIEDQLAVIDSRINQLIDQGLYDPNAPIPEIKEKDALTRLTEVDDLDDDVPEDPFKDLPFYQQLIEEAKTLTFKSPGWIVKNTIVVNVLVAALLLTVFAFDEILSPLSRDFYNYHPQSVFDIPHDFGDWALHVPERVGNYFTHFDYFEAVERKEKLGANYWGPLPDLKK